MSTIVFIHGMWHNGECFDHVVEHLKERGHNAVALTHRGNEKDAVNRYVTFDEIMDGAVEYCEKIDDRLIVVCHSSGGTVALNSIPRFSAKVDKVIFNNAFVLEDGKCQFDVIPPEVNEGMTKSANESSDNAFAVSEFVVRNLLMNRAQEEDIQRLLSLLVPQPLALMTGMSNSKAFFELNNIPKYMIHCTDDQSLPPFTYLKMFKNIPGVTDDHVVNIDGDHQTFFNNPELFADALVKCVEM